MSASSPHEGISNQSPRVLPQASVCQNLPHGPISLPVPSPRIIPSVDQQSHTWDDSEIVIHMMFTHIVTYYINCSRIWDTMSFGNGRPTVVPYKKQQLIFEWTIHCFFVVNKTSSSYISYLNVHPTLQVSKCQCYLV